MKHKIINMEDYCDLEFIENYTNPVIAYSTRVYQMTYIIKFNWKKPLKIPRDIGELFVVIPSHIRFYREDVFKRIYLEFREFRTNPDTIIRIACNVDNKLVILY